MKDELNVIQGRLQMFEEHDIRVEKTKEIRNILESFIYDTRTKVHVSFKSWWHFRFWLYGLHTNWPFFVI